MNDGSRRKSRALDRRLISLAVASCFATDLALANPVGPAVVSGQASFATVGRSLTVTNSPNAIINWQGFSIGAGELTRFQQQSAASAVLNRVVGQDPSAILGTLSSNGRVYLVNPNGILFGQGSRIDVAGLVATTLNLSNNDFLSGRLNFEAGAVANSIVNRGEIVSASGGRILLIAPDVQNHGLISSPQGEVVLAAGKSVQLVEADLPSLKVEVQAGGEALNVGSILAEGGKIGVYAGLINQRGVVRADSVSQDATGKIVFRASDTTILDAGSVVSASGAKGGEIQVLGNKVGLVGDARVDASGDAGGGTVLVGGDFQGKIQEVQNAFRTYFGPDATIKADAITSGDGGKVIVWADDATRAYGTITARGGSQAGDGGFVEVSGKKWLDFRASADVSAPQGRQGSLLLDPNNIEITATTDAFSGGAFSGGDPNIFGSGSNGTSQIAWTTIVPLLASGAVYITTAGDTNAGTADITVSADSPDLATANMLRMVSSRHILLNGSITNTGVGPLEMYAGWDGISPPSAPVTSAFGSIFVNSNLQTGGDLRLQGGSGALSQVRIEPSGSDLTIGVAGNMNVSGLDFTVEASPDLLIGRKVTITVGGTFDAQLTGAFVMKGTGASADGPCCPDEITSGSFNGSVSLQANAVNFNADGNITIAGGDSVWARAVSGNTPSINADATITATTSITLTGADITIRGGDSAEARATHPTLANTGVNVATANASASLSAGTSIDVSGTNITIRGGDSAVAQARQNGQAASGVNTGTATANANASLTASGDLSLVATNALLIRGGDAGGAFAQQNGKLGGVGSGVATLDAYALVSGGNVSLGGTSVTVRGGSGGAAFTCCNGTQGGSGSGQAVFNSTATVQATNDITINAGSLTVGGGDGMLASACCNGSSNGNGTGTTTANSRALLVAGRDITVVATGAVTIRGGNSDSATNCCNGSNGGQGTGNVDLNVDGEVNAGRNISITAASLTVSGGNNAYASACCNGSNGGLNGVGTATTNANALLSAGQNMTLTVTGGPVEIRGGNTAFASACCNGSNGAGTGTATANANATVSAGGSLTMTAGSLLVAGGDDGFAGASSNGGGGNGVGVATVNANATLSAGTTLTLGTTPSPLGSLEVRGGDNADASVSYVGNNTARTNANAQVLASNIAITVAGQVTMRGGFDASASASYGNSSALVRTNTATVNSKALVHATNDLLLTVTGGNVTISGGDGGGAAGSEAYGMQRATANADATLSAGGNVTVNVTGGNLTVRGGNNVFASASASSGNADVRAEASAKGKIAAGGTLGITVTGGSVTVQGGDSAFAQASGGSATNRMASTMDVSASLEATGALNITAASVTVRGGDNAFAEASNVGQSQATISTWGLASAGGALTINSTGGVTISGGDDVRASASYGQNTATALATGQLNAGGFLTINAGGLTVRGGIPGASFVTQVIGSGTNVAATNAGGSVVGANGMAYTGGALTVQGGTARSQGLSLAGNTATAQANALIQVAGTTTMNVTGNFEVIGGSALDNPSFSGGSAAATASLVLGTATITSSGIASIGTVTGVVSGNSSVTPSMTATPSGSIALNADEIDIGPNSINAGTGTVTLGTNSASRDLVVESGGPTPNVLSLTTTELSNVMAGTLVLRAGRDLYLNADIGASATPHDRNIELRAGNNAQITTNSMYLADNRNLTIVADNDNSGAGGANIGAVTLRVGSSAANTGGMTIAGQDINAIVSGGGSGNLLVTGTGTQRFTAAGDITFQNANTASGGLQIQGDGAQEITAGGSLRVEAGSGTGTFARVLSGGNQTVTAAGIALLGGSAGGGFGTGNFAQIRSNASQNITAGSGGLSLIGGGGTLTDNFASVFQAGLAGTSQTITVDGGGQIIIQGGSSAQTNTGVNTTASSHGSFAFIRADGASQAIDFTAGGSIDVTGGTTGSNNNAAIFAPFGTQTITGSPVITLTGGASGGVDGEGNFAGIFANTGLQTIIAGDMVLQAGAAGVTNSAFIQAPTQNITVHGNLVLNGGGSSAGTVTGGGAVIGGRGGSSPTATDLTLDVDGDVTLTGGSAAFAGSAIGSGMGGGQTTSITMDVGGNVTLNPGTIADGHARFGSPAAGMAGGDISVTAGGTIALNSTGPGLGTAIRTLGNVTLDAASITQGADSEIIAGGVTTLNGGTISLTSANNDFTGAVSLNSSGANNVAVTDMNAIVLGASSLGSGTLTVTAGGTITQTGAIVQAAGAGLANFVTTGAGSAITLSNAGNDFTGPVNFDSGAQPFTITDANSIILQGGAGPGDGQDITINANGTVSQNGAFVGTVGNVAVNAGVGPIVFTDPANNFVATSISANTTGAASLVNAAAVNLAASSIGGALSLTAGGVTQTGAIAVGGASTIDAGGSPITLTNSGNDFTGAVSLTSSGNVSITDANAITIGASSVGGTFTINAPSVSFLGNFAATNFSFSGPSYTLQSGTLNLAGTTTVSGSTTLLVSGGTLNASSGTIDVAGTVQTTSGALSANTVNVSGIFNASGGTVSAGTLNVLAGGTLMGTGTITGNVSNSAGTVAPGASPGILTINGNFAQGPSGTLAVDVGGTLAGSEYDQLVVNGNVSLGGSLVTTLFGTYVPAPGDSYTFISSSGTISGSFANINQPPSLQAPVTIAGPTGGSQLFVSTFSPSVPPSIEPSYNYTVVATDLTSEPVQDVLAPVIYLEITPTQEESTLEKKPPACS